MKLPGGSLLYWLLQLAGWGSMVAIETLNYTFFIIGEFSWTYLLAFSQVALTGLLVTHALKLILRRFHLFSQTSIVIWSAAIISTLLCSMITVFIGQLPSLIMDFNESISTLNGIYMVGLVINNGRYFIIWVVIFFMYEILKQKNIANEEKYLNFTRAKNFELELLKNQINPHFLFNALNSIKALVLIDANRSRNAIIKLSELLRYTLNYKNQQLVTIRDEMAEVQKYFELEKLRYGKRLTVKYSVSENVLDEFIPTVLILTLAENAIKHGASKHAGNVLIEVQADGNEEGYFVSVINTGKILSQNDRGIGLRHIHRQLEEHFDTAGSFTLSEKDSRVHAMIDIKQHENKNDINRRRAAGYSRTERITAGIS